VGGGGEGEGEGGLQQKIFLLQYSHFHLQNLQVSKFIGDLHTYTRPRVRTCMHNSVFDLLNFIYCVRLSRILYNLSFIQINGRLIIK
jgi:hypothetical protein